MRLIVRKIRYVSSEAPSGVWNTRTSIHQDNLNHYLLSPKVNIEPSLEELVGHQSHTKLWRRPAHTSWRGRGEKGFRRMCEQKEWRRRSVCSTRHAPPAPFHKARKPSSLMIFLKQSMTPV